MRVLSRPPGASQARPIAGPRRHSPPRAPAVSSSTTITSSSSGARAGAHQQHQGQARWAARAAAAAAGLLLLCAPGGVALAKGTVEGRPRVVDGDTLDFGGTRVRLFGIDAPESRQACSLAPRGGPEYACGQRAHDALVAKIGAAPVVCEQKSRDKYGRVVGVCSVAGAGEGGGGGSAQSLNAWMVEEGWAIAYRCPLPCTRCHALQAQRRIGPRRRICPAKRA